VRAGPANTGRRDVIERLSIKRARAALDASAEFRKQTASDPEKKKRREYRQLAEGLPADIHVCCLVPALAMLLSKEKDGGKQLFDHMADWLFQQWEDSPLKNMHSPKTTDRAATLTTLTGVGQADYLALKNEALEYAGWLKRLAQAFIEKDKPKEKEKAKA
jgi:CRISPR type III-B/RAMP module-associated protein Cmr5